MDVIKNIFIKITTLHGLKIISKKQGNIKVVIQSLIQLPPLSGVGPGDKNVFLFNTERDPSETTDVFEDYPDVSFSFFFCYFYINCIG